MSISFELSGFVQYIAYVSCDLEHKSLTLHNANLLLSKSCHHIKLCKLLVYYYTGILKRLKSLLPSF